MQIEQQLKLYIENTQQKLEESEKARELLSATNKNIMEKIRSSRSSIAGKDDSIFKSFENQALSTKDARGQDRGEEMSKIIQELATLRYTSKKDTQKISELETSKNKLESEYYKLRTQAAEKSKEYEKLYRKYEELKRKISKSKENYPDTSTCITDFYKRKYHEKCEEVSQLEKKFRLLRDKSNTPTDTLRRNPSTKSIRESSVGKSSTFSSKNEASAQPLKSDRSESPFLSTTRSSRPSHERSISVEKLKRSRPSSSNLSSYMLNTSRK